jgi:uncharacterized membrane protein
MMLVVSMPFQDSIVKTYIAGCIGATVLEYVTGMIMEALFKVRYWDYSKLPFNIKGRVCLGTTLAWGLLTILMTELIHVPIETFMLAIPESVLNVVTLLLTVYIVADFTLSFKAAVDLRDVLVKMEQIKEEMLHIQKRLEAIWASVNQGMENYKEAWSEGWSEVKSKSMEDVRGGIENKFESIKNSVKSKYSASLDSVKEELFELKAKYIFNVELSHRLSGLKDFFQRNLLRNNPNMTSKRFQEGLEELKQKAAEKREEKKEKQDKK